MENLYNIYFIVLNQFFVCLHRAHITYLSFEFMNKCSYFIVKLRKFKLKSEFIFMNNK